MTSFKCRGGEARDPAAARTAAAAQARAPVPTWSVPVSR